MTNNFTEEQLKDIEAAFPAVNCPVIPLGNRILVQIRLPKTKTTSGIILTNDTTEDNYRNEQTAKVLKIGAGAFTFPSSGEKWPSGAWFSEGAFVRVPLHGGDNHWTSIDEGDKTKLLLFKTFKDYEIIGLIEGNPLDIKTNLAYF